MATQPNPKNNPARPSSFSHAGLAFPSSPGPANPAPAQSASARAPAQRPPPLGPLIPGSFPQLAKHTEPSAEHVSGRLPLSLSQPRSNHHTSSAARVMPPRQDGPARQLPITSARHRSALDPALSKPAQPGHAPRPVTSRAPSRSGDGRAHAFSPCCAAVA